MRFALLLLLIIIAFFLNILGLLKLMPIYITSPLLFLSLLCFIYYMNYAKQFKGFKG
ncbi:hypothetical protein [Rossellomorea pakistanensis]|uniref:hypothetical protein n=1 Tax=Rossellomorea pakistanensis TaxID=992288 RepID=UPI003AEF2954